MKALIVCLVVVYLVVLFVTFDPLFFLTWGTSERAWFVVLAGSLWLGYQLEKGA